MPRQIVISHLRVPSLTTVRISAQGLLLFLVAVSHTGEAAALDPYFEKAIGRIEQALVHPSESYGFDITDDLTTSIDDLVYREGYSFYTRNGKVRYGRQRYDPERLEEPYFRSLRVYEGEGGEAKSVNTGKSGKTTLSVGVDTTLSYSVGQEDSYTYFGSKEENDARPDRQPFQILANPCFAPLKITPVALRNLPVKVVPDEGGNKVYELREKQGDKLMVLRLHFSPEHGHALVKSDHGLAKPGPDGALAYLKRTVRTVEEWQELSGGILVPARFTFESERGGKTDLSLVRVISNPVIGNMDEAMFDTSKIPEFNVKLDAIIDRAAPTVRNPKQATGGGGLVAATSRIVMGVAFVILLVVFIALYFRRRFDTQHGS